MHSVDSHGKVCVNLNDFNELSESIRFREKFDYLTTLYDCPKEVSNFSISMLFRGGQRYYISNLYLWAIPYRTEGLYRCDVDHDRSLYDGKEFFVQRDFKYDTVQSLLIHTLESRYKLHTTFAMIRQCHECDLIIEIYHNEKIPDPAKLYHQVRDRLEKFICYFFDAMHKEIVSALPKQKWRNILADSEYRKNVITRKIEADPIPALSTRELQCLNLIAQGYSAQETAKKLFISTETVNTYAKSIRQKLTCKNITEAVAKAFCWGLL